MLYIALALESVGYMWTFIMFSFITASGKLWKFVKFQMSYDIWLIIRISLLKFSQGGLYVLFYPAKVTSEDFREIFELQEYDLQSSDVEENKRYWINALTIRLSCRV